MSIQKCAFLLVIGVIALSPTDAQNPTMAPIDLPTEPVKVNCTLCVDGGAPNDLNARFTASDQVLYKCQDIYEDGAWLLTEGGCASLQDAGRAICQCEKELPTVNDCTLCVDGSPLPQPKLGGSTEDKNCAEMQVESQRDDEENCPAWQAVVGFFCQCPTLPASIDPCRLCGKKEAEALNFSKEVEHPRTGEKKTCGRWELEANLPPNATETCNGYQEIFETVCCQAAATSGTAKLQNLLFPTIASALSVATMVYIS